MKRIKKTLYRPLNIKINNNNNANTLPSYIVPHWNQYTVHTAVFRQSRDFSLQPLRVHLHKKERATVHANRAQLTERSQGEQDQGLTARIRLISVLIGTPSQTTARGELTDLTQTLTIWRHCRRFHMITCIRSDTSLCDYTIISTTTDPSGSLECGCHQGFWAIWWWLAIARYSEIDLPLYL